MPATLTYLLITAVRDRLFVAVVVAVALIALVGAFIADQTVIEDAETAASFVGFSVRLVVIVGIVLFVAVHVRRLFDTREILLLLSRPIGRAGFVLSYWASLSAISLMLTVPAAALLWWVADPPLDGLWVWAFTVAMEAVVMTGVALFFALGLGSVVGAVFATLAFYLLARMIGVLLAIAASDFRTRASDFDRFFDEAAGWLAMIVPRLDLYGQGRWLVYGLDDAGVILTLCVQSVVYTGLVLAAAVYDFERRHF